MALIKEGLWGIVNGTDTVPEEGAERAKFISRRDKALATIVLAVDPKLLYLIGGDPEDPVVVWRALANQFQRNTWANKLELKRKLFSLKLADGGSVQDHIKTMTEVFDKLSAIDEPVKEEDTVVYLLASLPECYNVLVTALEASPDVPTLAVVTECLLHEESKTKSRIVESSQEGALAVRSKKLRCHFCHKLGHFKKRLSRLCEIPVKDFWSRQARSSQTSKEKQNGSLQGAEDESGSESESTGLVVQHALSADSTIRGQWIVDSGATCHMCNSPDQFKLCAVH